MWVDSPRPSFIGIGKAVPVAKMRKNLELQEEREVHFLVLKYAKPGAQPQNIAVLLLDPSLDTLRMQFPYDWQGFDEDDLEVLSALAEDLQSKALELGATNLTVYLEETLSNTLLLSQRSYLRTVDPDKELDRLFKLYVQSTETLGAGEETAQVDDLC